MAWLARMASPARRVCDGVAYRLGFRKSGLMRLRREVRTCEYEDVHVMWELLTESGRAGPYRATATADPPRRNRRNDGEHAWALLFVLCRRF
ncbi:uncharacterized protein LOC122034548 [Zingiber officinale]|uniref:Uncharacterized protein n=1 Tax=Zingiber officinale TaxID=94328 RepID=A0A8J5ESM9_ZINOF|nr:uncharacterized protein LOC122034548 [Zingiber officinale]KAG6468629.1 hypothetical protein ZIOFF_073318 [Zingiber officinale]KAG6470366.1 hypothetical protein ZIOFF_071434 [Zingiber officinale]